MKESVKRQKRHETRGFVDPTPFLPPESQRVWWLTFGVLGLFGLINSGIRPGPLDPKAWYDRTLRIVGGLLILTLIGVGMTPLVREWLTGSR